MKYQRIQDLRKDNDITIKQISEDLGLHRDVYARYEKGIRDYPLSYPPFPKGRKNTCETTIYYYRITVLFR